ncbi:MAG: creatininase family protein [Peptococcaceae bacterium]
MRNYLQNMNWEEFERKSETGNRTVIIPVGSVEQHGYHLPLGTDTYVALTLAEDAAEQTNTVITPPLWFGWSPHHMVLPGTVTIRPEILIELLYDVISSLQEHGFTRFVLINGHRIVNVPWMQIAAERAQRLLKVKVYIFDPAYMSKNIVKELGFGPLGHADEIETSHMMYRYPELVFLERAKDNFIAGANLNSTDPAYPDDTLCYVPSTKSQMQERAQVSGGTSGEPTKSSLQKGKTYHEHVVNNLVRVIKDFQE